jgi:predicted MFS family arabinose efflux permease
MIRKRQTEGQASVADMPQADDLGATSSHDVIHKSRRRPASPQRWVAAAMGLIFVLLPVATACVSGACDDFRQITLHHGRLLLSHEPLSTPRPLLSLRGGATVPETRRNRKSSQQRRALSLVTRDRLRGGKSAAKKPEDARITFLIQLLFLTYYASLGSLLPYLPVYYHHLGHGGSVIGMLGAVKPFTTFIVAPLWGLIADQTQNPFLILQVTFLVSLAAQLLTSFRHDAYFLSFMAFVTALFNAPVKSLIDSMVMDHINDQSLYGRLRLWGQLGFGVGSSGVGMLLSKSKHVPWPEVSSFGDDFLHNWPRAKTLVVFADKCWRSLTGYKLLFMTHAALSVPTWYCIRTFRRLDREQKRQSKEVSSKKNGTSDQKGGSKITEGLLLLVHNVDALFFFFLVLVVGISSGVIENFAYVRMREVGGSGKEMGLSRLVSSLAGAPMFWFSGTLTEALGADRVIVLSLVSYVVRFLIYAFMRNAYHGLPAEALRGVTFAAFWSTGTIYAHRVSPPGLHATMLMFLNAMYGGLGQSLGAVIGGELQHRYGTVQTFLYAAAFDMVFVTLVVAYLYLRKESSFKDPKPIVAKEKKKSP